MRILIGMSGGLDSTYTAELLKANGHDVCGIVLKMHEYTDIDGARLACGKVGIPLEILDCSSEFEKYVIKDFIEEYSNGRTPNPCTVCNRYVKFRMLCEYAKNNGFDKVATGHYANVGEKDGRFFVRKGKDEKKDQSYMLWHLTQEQLSMLYLPLADEIKENVRENTRSKSFSYLSDKKESQEICFIPDKDYAGFIENRIGKFKEGDFKDTSGKTVGRHKGIIHYTIGQRKGLGIALGEPAYIVGIDKEKNEITVEKASKVSGFSFTAGKLNFQKTIEKDGEINGLKVKIRYAAPPVGCSVVIEDGKAKVTLDSEARAITPGQSAVFYDGDDIVFGGVIE